MNRQPHRDLPTLNLLRTFEAAGQHLSFKLAAEQLCVTPSAVSQQIQLLESQLGVQLFERLNRSLRFTVAGETYWQQVSQQLNLLRDSTTQLRQQHGHRRLRVSVMPPVANRVLFPNLEDFQQRYPDIELHIETALNYTDLQQRKADVAIRFGSPPWSGLQHEKLLDVSIQLVCPPGFSARFNLPHSTSNICQMPRIEMSDRPDSWQRFFEQTGLCNNTGNDAKVTHVDDYPAAIQAAENLGAALALYPIENPLIRAGRLESPFPPLGPLSEAVYAVYAEQWQHEPAARAFISWISEQLNKLSDK